MRNIHQGVVGVGGRRLVEVVAMLFILTAVLGGLIGPAPALATPSVGTYELTSDDGLFSGHLTSNGSMVDVTSYAFVFNDGDTNSRDYMGPVKFFRRLK